MTAGGDSAAPDGAVEREAGGPETLGDPAAVYDPAGDSMLVAEAAIEGSAADDTVVDVGTGSGVVAARVASETGARVVGVDVNPHACRLARARSRPGVPAGDGAPLSVIRGDLVAPIRDGGADLVVFNPPYLPDRAQEEERPGPTDHSRADTADGSERPSGERDPQPSDDWLRTAYAGGASGRAVIAPFLDAVDRVLAPGGRVLLLVSTLTGVDAVRDLAREAGFVPEQVAEESIPFERLVVLELERA